VHRRVDAGAVVADEELGAPVLALAAHRDHAGGAVVVLDGVADEVAKDRRDQPRRGLDRHRGVPCQGLVHQALEVGREVLDQDERRTGPGGKPVEQQLDRLEPPGGGADRHDVAGRLVALHLDLDGKRVGIGHRLASPARNGPRGGATRSPPAVATRAEILPRPSRQLNP